ncbi:MAG: flagellar hook-length control protein FliK [Defluviitaleaceae bacterium]|nr:flagellar hook-length control protein FliK [Defluviitaleaceae bacterium]
MINSLTRLGVQVSQNRNNRVSHSGEGGFESVIASAANAEVRQERPRGDREVNRNQRPAEATNRVDAEVNTRDGHVQIVQTEETTQIQGVYGDVVAEYAPIVHDYVDADQIMAEMAAVLGITVEELQQVLHKLEMPLEALADADNRALVLMTAKGLESQVELLSYPEALPVLKELAKVAEDYQLESRPQPQIHLTGEFVADEGEEMLLAEEGEEFPIVVANSTQNTASTTTQSVADVAGETIVPVSEVPQSVVADIVPQMPTVTMDVPVQNNTPIQSAPTTVPTPVVTPQTIADQIVQQVRFVTGEGMAEMKIQLKPEHLGDLTLKIGTLNGIVTAQFTAENQRVKELIEAGFNALRDSLEEAGINVSEIEVNVRNENDANEFEQNQSRASDKRIRDMIAAAMAEDEAVPHTPTIAEAEENVIDYQV